MAKKAKKAKKRFDDPFLDEIYAIKRAVWDAAGRDIGTLVAKANKAGAERHSRQAKDAKRAS